MRFKRRKLVEEIFGQLGVGCGGVVVGVLDDAFADGQGQVEAAKGGVALLKPGDDAQGVEVVVEAEPGAAQAVVKSFFSGVAERRVADIVGQRQGFGQFRIQPQSAGQSAGDLGYFKRMRKAAAEVVGGGSAGRRAKTWVFPARRRKARACRMRAASRAKGVR